MKKPLKADYSEVKILQRKRFPILIIYVAGFLLLLYSCEFSSEYGVEYVFLLISYVIVGGLLCFSICKRNADLFEPIILIFLLWIGLFSVAPILLTKAGRTSIYSVGFMEGCLKGTGIYIAAAIAFYLGYYSTKVNSTEMNYTSLSGSVVNTHNMMQLMTIIWFVCYSIALGYEVLCLGRSFSYILSIGRYGEISDAAMVETSLAFLINFAYSLIIPWLYIMFISHNQLLKIMTTTLMVVLYVVCGWRFILVIMGLSFVTVYYVNKNRRPKVAVVLGGMVLAIVVFTLIGNARHDIRNGSAFEWYFDLDTILATFETNFNLYQPYYGVVAHYPKDYSFTLGEGMIFDTLITFVPRAIWPGKPLARDFASLRAIRQSMGDAVIDKAAMAIPNIGEIYIDFGTLGVVFLMFIWGKLMRKCTRLYKSCILSFEHLLLYSAIYSLAFQFVTRGYMPNNFYLAIFVLWPGILMLFLNNQRIKV